MPDDEYSIFRYNVRLLRASRQLSSKELATAMGMRYAYRLIDLEYGRLKRVPKISELTALAKFFDVSMEDLLHRKAVVTFTSIETKQQQQTNEPDTTATITNDNEPERGNHRPG